MAHRNANHRLITADFSLYGHYQPENICRNQKKKIAFLRARCDPLTSSMTIQLAVPTAVGPLPMEEIPFTFLCAGV